VTRALLFDFNGTLSDDEPVLCEIWQEIFAEHGRPLTREQYFGHLAGLSDPEIAEAWLGDDPALVETLMRERVRRYRERVGDGSTITPSAREAVAAAAARVPVGVVSGAARSDIELVLAAAGLADSFAVVVAAEDVANGKPDPEPYLLALARLDPALEPSEAVALEDSEAGVAAAKAAGLGCVAVLGTADRSRLALADEIVERVDADLVRRLLA
jgi:beta-phosphoglucomutase